MKRKKRLFGILLIITALIIMQLPVAEADAATSASDFKMEDTTLVKYRGKDSSVSIPNTVETIGEKAFENNEYVETIVIPKSVKQIEPYAFWGCENLETVVLGSGLTEVGDFVFTNCKSLESISLPEGIRSIGIQAFADCVNLKDIYIAPEVTRIHETAFDGCYQLIIHCEKGSVADDYSETFYEKQEEMPEYEDVDDYEADEDTTEEIVVETPEVDDNSESAYLGSTQVVGNQAVVFLDNTSLQVLDGELIVQEEEAQQQEKKGIPKYTIVDGRIVADQAFYRNQALQNVAIPEGVTEIGQFSFARSSVTQVTVPEGVTAIGYGAFYHCDALTEVTLPQTTELVEPKAFEHTAWVANFREEAEEDFLISGGVLVAYAGTDARVRIPEGVRVIAGEVFEGHYEITEVYLPDSLVSIGEAAFENCRCISTVHFNNQIKQIKDRAFANTHLSEVILPAAIEELGLKVFDEEVEITYAGEKPSESHELSAERLSNDAYRDCMEEIDVPGVEAVGLNNVQATLEGGAREYTLSIVEVTDKTAMAQAYQRCFEETLPSDMVVYALELTDNSKIPITRLGKQLLQVTIPVPKILRTQNIQVYTMDRNGQLETVDATRVKVDGVDCFRFTTDYVSQYGVTGGGESFEGVTIIEETTSIVSMSEPPAQSGTKILPQMVISSALLLVGTICIFWKKK